MDSQKFLFGDGHHSLAGCIFDPSGVGVSRPGVLFIHGQNSSQKAYEERARIASRDLDAICMTFDLSGHGYDAPNFERYSVYDHLDDVVTAYDYLAAHDALDQTRIGVCGASYGGYLAALLTAHRAVKRLILRAPALSKDIAFPVRPTAKGLPHEVPDGFDSLQVLGRYPGEVLMVESENDEVIPASHITAYLLASPHAQHQVIPEAGHALTNPTWDEVFVKAIVNWFREL